MYLSKKSAALILLTILFLMPLQLHGKNTEIYTIQTGSFIKPETAMKEFDALKVGLLGLNGMTLDYLRIEKIGKFYAVRVGKFMNYIDAAEYLQGIRFQQISGAIILKSYIKEERIIKRYGEDLAVEDAVTAEERLPPAAPEKAEEALLPEKPVPEKEPEIPEKGGEVAEAEKRKDEAAELELYQKPERNAFREYLSKIRGKIYISDYYSRDSDDYDLHVLTSRLNLYVREEEAPGFYFEFDGRVRKKIVEGDLRHVPRYKVDEAWLGYKFPGQKLRVIAGRQYIIEMYNTEIDGLNINYSFDNGLGLGAFGGLAPDKFDDSLNDDYNSFGAYGFLNLDDHKVSLGYEYLTYNGEPDREYFSIRAYSKLSKKIRFNGLSSVSKNQTTDNYEVETANGNLTYSYSRNLRFKVFGNYYRTIKYYESSKFYYEFSDTDDNFLLDTNSQTRAGLRVDYKIAKGLKLYGSTAYQHREVDNEDSTRFTGGIRKYDLYGFDLSGRYTYIDNYSSRDHEYNVEIYRNIMKKFDVSVYASYEETKLDLENAYTSGARTYGSTLYWPITKKLYLSMFFEYLDEDDYSNTSLFTQLGYKISP